MEVGNFQCKILTKSINIEAIKIFFINFYIQRTILSSIISEHFIDAVRSEHLLFMVYVKTITVKNQRSVMIIFCKIGINMC